MSFWAIVSDEIGGVVKFFPSRWAAEKVLARALWDAPAWRGTLRVERIELLTGSAN